MLQLLYFIYFVSVYQSCRPVLHRTYSYLNPAFTYSVHSGENEHQWVALTLTTAVIVSTSMYNILHIRWVRFTWVLYCLIFISRYVWFISCFIVIVGGFVHIAVGRIYESVCKSVKILFKSVRRSSEWFWRSPFYVIYWKYRIMI